MNGTVQKDGQVHFRNVIKDSSKVEVMRKEIPRVAT